MKFESMKIKKFFYILIIFGLISINFLNLAVAESIVVSKISIKIPETNGNTKYEKICMIRGIWHRVNLTLNKETSNLSLILYHGSTLPNSRDETNYYKWAYNNGEWKDIFHNKYINPDYCYHDSFFYSFYLGIDQYAKVGNWTFEIYSHDEKIYSSTIYVDSAVVSLVLKSVPVNIRVEPFTEADYVSENEFIIENDGNIPMLIFVSYGKFGSVFTTSGLDTSIKPGQVRNCSIIVHSLEIWKPGSLKIRGDAIVYGNAKYVIPPKRNVNLIESNVSIVLPINLYIGHSGYEIKSLAGDITFQYERKIIIYYGEIKRILSYISGNGLVTINISGEKIDIVKVMSGGRTVSLPFTITSTNKTEYPIAVEILGLEENITGYLNYVLESGGEKWAFKTVVEIGPKPPSPKEEKSQNFSAYILILSALLIVFVYILISYIRYRKKRR